MPRTTYGSTRGTQNGFNIGQAVRVMLDRSALRRRYGYRGVFDFGNVSRVAAVRRSGGVFRYRLEAETSEHRSIWIHHNALAEAPEGDVPSIPTPNPEFFVEVPAPTAPVETVSSVSAEEPGIPIAVGDRVRVVLTRDEMRRANNYAGSFDIGMVGEVRNISPLQLVGDSGHADLMHSSFVQWVDPETPLSLPPQQVQVGNRVRVIRDHHLMRSQYNYSGRFDSGDIGTIFRMTSVNCLLLEEGGIGQGCWIRLSDVTVVDPSTPPTHQGNIDTPEHWRGVPLFRPGATVRVCMPNRQIRALNRYSGSADLGQVHTIRSSGDRVDGSGEPYYLLDGEGSYIRHRALILIGGPRVQAPEPTAPRRVDEGISPEPIRDYHVTPLSDVSVGDTVRLIRDTNLSAFLERFGDIREFRVSTVIRHSNGGVLALKVDGWLLYLDASRFVRVDLDNDDWI